ncbi:MAG: FG-GAP and VCBS repeat-containing protein [Deltaproteobacteria bacterium]|nr:FG-GAP and VCBS repeat-containing protein [Deltaproteobacteria bacterium]
MSSRFVLCFAAIAATQCAPTSGLDDSGDVIEPTFDVTLEERAVRCDPLRIEPATPRVATERAIQLRAVGGSGLAPFTVEGMSLGSYVEPGGGFRAGSTAGRVEVIARDTVCGLTARATIEVVGPFVVTPERASIARGEMVRFVSQNAIGPVVFELFARPAGTTMGALTPAGVFTAGAVDGEYQIVARDEGALKSTRLTVTVGMASVLRPRSAILAVPAGLRVPLFWTGGSGLVDLAVSDATKGRTVTEGGTTFFEAAATAVRSSVDVTATDRATRATARVRVLIADLVAPSPQRRGLQTLSGDMVTGDFNGDGRVDLAVGHGERAVANIARNRFTARNAGGVLIFNGAMDGTFASEPSSIVDGEFTEDRFGSVLTAQDVNGDSIDDLLVGVPDSDLGEGNRGAFALHLGSPEGITTTPERVLNGEDTNDRYGSAVLTADLNGDRAPDLIVSAPNAIAPMDRARPAAARCQGGRLYVYRGLAMAPGAPPVRGVYESVPWQVLDVRAPLSDDPSATPSCAVFSLGAGTSMALLDVDNDNVLDLAVGAPFESHAMTPTAGLQHGVVLIYRGIMNTQFERTPAWAIHLAPTLRHGGSPTPQFGTSLDVIRENAMAPAALVVRSPTFAAPGATAGSTLAASGGLWVFTAASLGAPLAPAMDGTRPIKVLTTDAARSFMYGDAATRGLGRHAVVTDADGDGANDYVVSAAHTSSAAGLMSPSGAVYRLPVQTLISSMGRVMLPTREIETTAPMAGTVPTEMTGFRLASVKGTMGQGAGLAVWHAWRDTTAMVDGRSVLQPFAGAIEYITPGASAVGARWSTATNRRSITLPLQPSGEQAGTTVGFGALSARTEIEAVVNAPFSHSPMTMTARAGQTVNTGAIELYPSTASTPLARYARTVASGAASQVVVLDFDGDGVSEIAVAEQSETVSPIAGTGPGSECNNVELTTTADGGTTRTPVALGNRGVIHIYSLQGGQLVERFRAVSRPETLRRVGGTLTGMQLNRTGFALAAADVDGDNRDDLIVGRPGGTDSNGAEVILGRANSNPMAALTVCNTGNAYSVGPFAANATHYYGFNVTNMGDLNRDGCDEIGVTLVRNGAATNPSAAARTGFALVFGANTDAARTMPAACAFRRPATVLIVPDERNFANNVVGDAASRDDDVLDLAGVPGTMGRVFALGAGDLDGDARADVVYRTTDLAWGPFRGPAVEVLSGAGIADCARAMCPANLRTAFFRDGEYMTLGVRTLDAPERLVVPAPSAIAPRFGTALAISDVDGDGASELFVGSADDSLAADFAGVVMGYRGGRTTFTQAALTNDPWLVAVGDLRERGSFGAALAASDSGGWLLVGAPLSSRLGAGGELGSAWRWRVEVPR